MKRILDVFYAAVIAIASCAFFSPSAVAQVPATSITILIPAIPPLGPSAAFDRIAQVTSFLNNPLNGNYATTLKDGQNIGIEWTGGTVRYLSVYTVSVANGSVGISAEALPPSVVSSFYNISGANVHTCGSGAIVTWEGYLQNYTVTNNGSVSSGSVFVVTGVHYTMGLCGNNI